MAKKILFFIFALVLTIFLISFVSAAKIAYVVQTPSPVNTDETAIINLLKENGNNVTLLDDVIFNADSYDIIIVGEEVGNIKGIFDNKNHKTIFLSQDAAKAAGLSYSNGKTTSGYDKITISNNNNIITEGFTLGDLTIYKSSQDIGYAAGCKAINSKSLAYRGDTTRSVILILEKNSLLLDESGECNKRNVNISQRNMLFGLPRASQWQDDTKTLFLNSIQWMIHGDDADNDGYYYDQDCNDNDASKWQMLDGYVDNDDDGEGTGSQLGVCSGDELPEGYSEINGDCNDSNQYKWQFLEGYVDNDDDEYGTGELLNICSGYGLPVGYSESDGDCNDDNSEINPGAEEMQYDGVDSNCDNGVEFLSEIPDIEWNEDESLIFNLSDYAWNPSGDKLEFYIYDTSEEKYISVRGKDGIFNFSSAKDWNGEDWIIFSVASENSEAISNNVTLRVFPVNDTPRQTEIIDDITCDENSNLTDYIDLNYYFYDPDENELTFSVFGNNFINVILDNGLVSFYPRPEWFGTETISFSADDGSLIKESNNVTLTVNKINHPPQFDEINCNSSILEDTQETCLLSASDFENDTLEFSISDENNLNCEINGNEVKYISKKDYNGEASCDIRVSDGTSYGEYTLSVEILPVNDAPKIRSYAPSGTQRFIENTSHVFSISAFDVDGDSLEKKWFVDNVEVANGSSSSYTFNKEKGNYEVKMVVSDGQFEDENIWNVFVGSLKDFTCSEVGGYSIDKKEACLGDLLLVKDSDTNICCSVPGQPKFSDIERCNNLTSNLNMKIEDPSKNDKFNIGDTINGNIKIENNLNEDLDFNAEIYLYDLTDDSEVDNYEDSISIAKDDSDEFNFELKTTGDLDEKNDYALFAKVMDDNEDYCNNVYIPIDIARLKYDVVIKSVKMDEKISCGSFIDADVKVQNLGTKDDNVYLTIENSDLNISEKTDLFKLEKYGDKDEITQSLQAKIPSDAKEGEYDLKITAFFNDGSGKTSLVQKLVVNCEKIEETQQTIEKTLLKLNNTEAKKNINNKNPIIILLVIMLFTLIIIIILLNIGLKRR